MTLQHISTQTGVSDNTSDTSEGGTKSLSGCTGGLITSLHPLRIHGSTSEPPRAPTLRECEVIIRQLYNANSLQSQEVSAPDPHKSIPLLHAYISAVCVSIRFSASRRFSGTSFSAGKSPQRTTLWPKRILLMREGLYR